MSDSDAADFDEMAREQMNEVIDGMVAIDGVNESSSRFVMDEVQTEAKLVPCVTENVEESLLSD